MPAPTTIDEFLELVRKSGVIDEKRLQAHVDRLRESNQLPAEPVKLATQLVRDGVLTHFQAEQFLQGKWRRFTIGKYKVLERLGAGGMGSVYLCEHMLMRRRVAVKVLPASKADDSSCLERFYREARAVAALDHPNIVRAYDIDQDENLHFLVMEHVDGSSLQEIIKRTGSMDVLRTAHYVRQAALGLQHAHETAGLVHRDIKPGNILVDRNGIVKILDMGLARFFHDEEDELTKKYDENVLGTADYLAPEQALDSHSADIRADIYSLGGTFYYCLTGRTPFAEGTVAQKLIWHQTRQPKPIRSVRPDVPDGIVTIIERMMAKDRGERYQSPQEVADVLAAWTQTPIPPPPDNEMPQFSPAARSSGPPSVSETGLSSSTRPSADTVPTTPAVPRKPWQVSGAVTAPAPSTVTGQANTTSARTPPSPVPTPRPAPVQPASVPPPLLRSPAPSAPTTPVQPPLPTPAPARVEVRPPSPAPAPAPRPVSPSHNGPLPVAVKPASPTMPAPFEDEEPDAEDPASDVEPPQRRRLPRSIKKQRRTWLWVVLALAAFLVPGICILVYVLTSHDPNRTIPPSERDPIRVGAGSNALFMALRQAKSGDRIVLTADVNECNLHVNQRDLIIEAEPGKKITWKCPGGAAGGAKLLNIQSTQGVQLRNLTLDGNKLTEAIVTLYSKCPGVKLENIEMINTKKYGVLITNCEGTAERPVEFQGVTFRMEKDQTAVRFDIQGHTAAAVPVNRYFNFRNCTFAGPGKKVTTRNRNFVNAGTIELPGGVTIDEAP